MPRIGESYKRHGNRFVARFCHENEIAAFEALRESAQPEDAQVRFLASRWAAKEAAYKAFGRWRVQFPEMEVVTASAKQPPQLRFHGGAAELCEDQCIVGSHISISHDKEYATAYVVLEAVDTATGHYKGE